MCSGTCNKCNTCEEACECVSSTKFVCKPKKKCTTSLPAHCIEDLHEYLYDTLLFGECLYPTIEKVNGKNILKININPGCVNNFSSSNCIPVPITPTITASDTNVTSGNYVTLTVSNYNGVVNWFNQGGEQIGSGITINVGAGTYYAKSLTACGYSKNSNIVVITLINSGVFTASRSATFTKTCLPGCVSTSVVFTKSYTASSQILANNLANSDSVFNAEGQAFAESNAECNCNYCSNTLSWTTPIITCLTNTTKINISVSGNGSNQVEFYDYSIAGNTPYNPNGWVLGQSLNSYTSPTNFTSDGELKQFKARLKNCTSYIDGSVAVCNGSSITYSTVRSATFERNNCAAGCTPGTSVFSKTYTAITQQQADSLAANDSLFNTEGQAFANANALCTNCCTQPVNALILGLGTIQIGTNNIYTLENNNLGNVTYSWSSGVGISLTNTNTNSVTVNAAIAGTYTLQCIISNSCGSVTMTKQIVVQTGVVTPTITINSNNPSC